MDSEQDDVQKARQAAMGGWFYESTAKPWSNYTGSYKPSSGNSGMVIGATLLVIALLATFFFLDLSPGARYYFAIGFRALTGIAAGIVCYSLGRLLRFNAQFRMLLSVLVAVAALLLLL